MYSSGVFRVLVALIIGVFFSVPYASAGWFDKKPAREPPKAAPQQPKPAPAPVTKPSNPAPQKEGPKVVSEITWGEVHKKFVQIDNHLTSAQRSKLEKDRKQWWQEGYRSKWVRWRGTVKNVSSEGSTVKIDMGEGSWRADVVLTVTPDSKEKAIGLNQDSYVSFVGRMSEQPGILSAMELQEVTIE